MCTIGKLTIPFVRTVAETRKSASISKEYDNESSLKKECYMPYLMKAEYAQNCTFSF